MAVRRWGGGPDALTAQGQLRQQLDLGLLTSGQVENKLLQVKPQSLSWRPRRLFRAMDITGRW